MQVSAQWLRSQLSRFAPTLGDNHYLGRYTIEKLHLFDHYQRTTSGYRVAAVILLTPLPTVLALVAVDAVPLNRPSSGPSHNAVAFVRSTVSHAMMTFFTLLPLKQAIKLPDRGYAFHTIALIACCVSLTVEAVCIPLAFVWRFPVPFREMLGLPVWMTCVCLYNYIFARDVIRWMWRRGKLQQYLPIVGVQISLFYLFLSLSVGFSYLSIGPQVIMVLTFPLVKVVLKELVWKYARRLDDVSTDVTICMLEVSGSLYQTVCIESVSTPWLGLGILVMDLFQAIHEVHTYVKVDYLGDGRKTLVTALKIVESSIAQELEDRSSTTTHSTAMASLAEAIESSRVESSPQSEGPFVAAPFSRRYSRQSSLESLVSMVGDEAQPRQRKRQVYLQGNSVIMQPKLLHERQGSGKKKRRLLDLDELHGSDSQGRRPSIGSSPPPLGRKGSLERIASGGLLSPDELRAFNAQIEAKPESALPPSLPQVKSSALPPAQASSGLLPFFRSGPTKRSAIVMDVSLLYADLSTLPTPSEEAKPAQELEPSRASSYFVVPSETVTGPASKSPFRRLEGKPIRLVRRRSSIKKRRTHHIVIDGVTIHRRDQARILEQTLQLLFSSEVLLFAEYMEVAIPVVYTLAIGSEWGLPNRQYNLLVRSMSVAVVTQQLWTSAVYALVELVSMLAMYWVLRSKYGVSAMYQLAFVLERYWMTLQGKLVGSFLVVLNAVTVHQGTDFTFKFEYHDDY